jgi:hypothetical protein
MTNQELFKQAIADAKSVRDAAVANAKAALEETFTPSIMNMLSAKLNELEEDEDMKDEGMKVEEEGLENAIGYEAGRQKPAIEEKETEEEGYDLEETDLDAILAELEKEGEDKMEEGEKEDIEEAKGKAVLTIDVNDADDLDEEAERFVKILKKVGIKATAEQNGVGEVEITVDSADKSKAKKALENDGWELNETKEKDDKKEKVEESLEEAEADDEITELTVDELKDIIRDVLKDVMGGEEEAGEEAGEEGEEEVEDDTEINLDELLAELEKEEEGKEKVEEVKDKEEEGKMEEVKKELEEAVKTIKTLQSELNEVNLLNAKLLYTNKIFKAKSLNEAQKVSVLKAFDRAENVREVKNVYNTLAESFTSKTKQQQIKESVGFASKALGVAPKQQIVEGDSAIRRMQQLAGIIK